MYGEALALSTSLFFFPFQILQFFQNTKTRRIQTLRLWQMCVVLSFTMTQIALPRLLEFSMGKGKGIFLFVFFFGIRWLGRGTRLPCKGVSLVTVWAGQFFYIYEFQKKKKHASTIFAMFLHSPPKKKHYLKKKIYIFQVAIALHSKQPHTQSPIGSQNGRAV